MVELRTLWLALPRRVRTFPPDLAVVIAFVVGAGFATFVPVVRETPLRLLFGVPFVALAPGYALTAALFPGRGDSITTDTTSAIRLLRDFDTRIDVYERFVLSVGLSIAVVPLFGLILNFTPWGIEKVPVVLSVSGFTVGTTVVAAVRRWQLPPDERFRVPVERWSPSIRTALFDTRTRADTVLNVVIALALVVALGSGVYAVAAPNPGQSYSSLSLLTQEDGQLVASSYPSEFVSGEGKPLVAGVTNNENEWTNYTLVVEVQNVSTETGRVVEQERLHSFRFALAPKETWHRRHVVSPEMTGTQLRLQYLLYLGDAPPDPRIENAYRQAHLWINVTSSQGQ